MTALAANALTSLQAVKQELRLTTNDDDVYLRRQINSVSGAIEDFLGRPLGYQAGIVELVAGFGGNRILVSRRPVLVLTAITFAGQVSVDVADVEIEDAEAGWLYWSGGFPWTVPMPTGTISGSPLPGHEDRSISVTYSGGYVLPAGVSPTLPAAIEDAAILAVSQKFQQRGRDRSATSERLMSYGITYGGGRNSTATTARMFPSSPFSDEVTSLLTPYRDVAQA